VFPSYGIFSGMFSFTNFVHANSAQEVALASADKHAFPIMTGSLALIFRAVFSDVFPQIFCKFGSTLSRTFVGRILEAPFSNFQ
jgi:hypothetical protein